MTPTGRVSRQRDGGHGSTDDTRSRRQAQFQTRRSPAGWVLDRQNRAIIVRATPVRRSGLEYYAKAGSTAVGDDTRAGRRRHRTTLRAWPTALTATGVNVTPTEGDAFAASWATSRCEPLADVGDIPQRISGRRRQHSTDRRRRNAIAGQVKVTAPQLRGGSGHIRHRSLSDPGRESGCHQRHGALTSTVLAPPDAGRRHESHGP